MEKTYERCKTCIHEDLENNICKFGAISEGINLKPLNDDMNCAKYFSKEEYKEMKKAKMTVEESVYRQNIIDKMDKQIQKGIDKYGTTLEENTWLDTMGRLTYLQEELIDGLMYIEHIKAKLQELDIELD